MNNSFKLLLLVLLVKPLLGLGQQQPASRLETLVAAAQQAQAAHNYAAAANDYKQAIRIEPNMPELWANLGLMQQNTGDTSQAILSFQQANRLNPSLYVPNLFLGIDYLHAGKAPEAIPFLIKAEKSNKTDPQAPLALGRAYFATGKFSAAAREFVHTTTLDPRLAVAWFDLGIARLDQVEADARRMSEEGKDSAFAGALYAASLVKQARFKEAATLYKSLIAIQPQPPCIYSELGFSLLRERDLSGAAAEFAAERAQHSECGLALLGQARIAMESGENEQAVKLLQELWSRDQGFVESNATVLLEGLPSDRISAVLGYLTQENSPTQVGLRSALLAAFNLSGQDSGASPEAVLASAERRTAEGYYAAGEFHQCARRLEMGLAAESADKLRLLAACSYFAGDNERASSAANAMEALQPHSLEALYWSIQANEHLALKALAQFQQMEPESSRSYVLLGDIYQQLERFDNAQAEYSKALALAPGDAAAMLGLASAYLANNNQEKAIETARLAIERSPDDPEVNLVMAEAMLGQNQFADAEPFLIKALKAKPQMLPRVHALIGKVYAETGRTQDAIDQLKMGASSDEDGSLYYQLARLYQKVGDSKDAADALGQMKLIKQKRRERGVKTVEDIDLSALEASSQ
ncbi:MAG: tetratricopeptide repeat protein [Terracidiphilus sp.]